MKLRCPYCKSTFADLKARVCPVCSRGLRPPETARRLPKKKSARPAGSPRMPPRPPLAMLPLLLFAARPRRMLLIIVVVGVFAAGLLMTRVETGVGRPQVSPRVQRTQAELKVLRTALEWFSATCDRYPTTEEGLKALVRDPGITNWQGFYIESLMPDVWGRPYQYAYSNDTVVLFSLGPDGAANTADDLASPAADLKEIMDRIMPPGD